MAEMVGGELRFVTARVARKRWRHDARIVDQDVERIGGREDALRKSVDRRRERVLEFLERSVWPTLPKRERGRRLTRAEEDEILGYGRGGV